MSILVTDEILKGLVMWFRHVDQKEFEMGATVNNTVNWSTVASVHAIVGDLF